MRKTFVAVVLTCMAFNAHAGRACTERTLRPDEVRAGLDLALQVRDTLDQAKADVAIVARVGRDLSRYGLRYSHVGFVWRGHPRGEWTVVNELNQCGTAESALYDQGLGDFFLDDMFAYEAEIVIPSPAVQRKIDALLAARDGDRLHEPHYNLVAYAWGTRYQNSNQWLLETTARALAVAPVVTRAQAQAWLRDAGFQPSTIHLSAMERLGGELSQANIAFDDHPLDRRMAGEIDVVSAESVLGFLHRIDAGATVRVLTARVISETGPSARSTVER